MNTPNFENLFEEIFPVTWKEVRRTRYPKEMQFSPEFLEALKTEYNRLKHIHVEDEEDAAIGVGQPIKNLASKFIKAVDFRIKVLENDSDVQ